MSSIKNKRVLVTGGGGSIGSELVRQLAPHNKVFILDTNETAAFDLREELTLKGYWVHSRCGDVRDQAVVRDVFEDFKPQYVFHASALKHVKPNEEYPIEAIKTNILGTYNVLQESRRWECLEKFVFISTDKVVNPSSVMGATKKVAEVIVKNAGYVAVRFGNVMGSRGSVIPFWESQMNHGDPITVTDPDMERYMMTIPQACELVIEAATQGNPGETLILDMGKPVKIGDLAQRIVEELKHEPGSKVIGKRPGENMREELMTEEEKRVAIKRGKFHVIPCATRSAA